MKDQASRYQKQFLFPKIGEEGQKKLLNSRVTVIGCGALGSNIANLVVRAGVGFVRLIDRDFLEISNLQRQTLFDEDDLMQNLPKAVAAVQKLKKINSEIVIEDIVDDVNFSNVESFIQDVDLVLDGTDNFETRYLINDVCIKLNKTWIYGACVGSEGLVMPVVPGKTGCLRCVFESAPPLELNRTCDTAGVIGTIASIVASYQVTEAIKWLSGNHDDMNLSLSKIDIWNVQTKSIDTKALYKKSNCVCCKQKKFEYLNSVNAYTFERLCGANAIQISSERIQKIDFVRLSERLKSAGQVNYNSYLLRFVADDSVEITVFSNGRTIVKGTSDPARAKSLYAKYIGG